MKKVLTILCAGVLASLLCVACGNNGGEPTPPEPPEIPKESQEVSYYYLKDKKIELAVRKDQVIIKAASEIDAEALSELDIFVSVFPMRSSWRMAEIDPETTTIGDVRALPGVLCAAYGLEDDRGPLRWPTDQVFVKPAEGKSIESILDEAKLGKYIEKTELFSPYSGSYLITLGLGIEYTFWASNEFYETGMCEYAEPDFVIEIIPGK